MNTRPIEIESRIDGAKERAELLVCNCGSIFFLSYQIEGQNHPHLQCQQCGDSYCAAEPKCAGVQQSEPVRRCRVCGCTENNACVTDGEPCHWAEPDLCSACFDTANGPTADAGAEILAQTNHPSGPLQLTALDLIALKRTERVACELDAVTGFQVLAALQLALRHPGLSGTVAETAARFARGLQEYVSVTENVARIPEAGWNPMNDMPTVPESRIILPGQ